MAPEVEAAVLDRIGALAQHEAVLAKVVTATNRRTAKEVPDLRKQHHALMTQLNDVKASAGKLLDTWQQSDSGRGFVNERLGELGQQREYLEHCIADLNQRIEAATAHQVDTNQVRMALSNIHAIYGELQPYERRELVHLVVHRVELGASKLVLEINGGVCTVMGETPLVAHNGSLVRRTQDWLPGAVSQSVFRQAFRIHLRSLVAWSRRRGSNPGDLRTQWQTLLDLGFAPTRATLARMQGVSRARVTQVLGPVAQ